MECMELDCSSSSSCTPDSESSSDQAVAVSSKRKAGRKKFKETRHPVFRGVRQRKGNKWVCEVREPYKKSRIWLGTFTSPEMAARAYDVAALALRGTSAALNFPDSASILPRAKSSSPKDIQTAALAAAEAFRPRPPPPPPTTTTTTTAICSPPSLSLETIYSPSTSSTSFIPNEKNQEKKALDHTHKSLETNPNQSNVPLFIDEEALFNLPGLLDSMAEGMLIAPPAMHRQADWDDGAATINIDLWVD